MVTVDELVKAVDIALGGSPPEACTAYYSTIVPVVTDIIVAVNNALEQCAVLPPTADLVPTSVRVFSPAFCGSNAPILEICVANIGQTSAAQFNVATLMGRLVLQFAWFGDLRPGEEECQTRSYPLSQLDTEFKVDVDVEGVVAEGRVNNNSATFALGTPPPAPTCTASATPTVVE
jgi:hypothetical protein